MKKINPNRFDAKFYQIFNKYKSIFYNKKIKLRKTKLCLFNFFKKIIGLIQIFGDSYFCRLNFENIKIIIVETIFPFCLRPSVCTCNRFWLRTQSPTSKENPFTCCLINCEAKGVVYHQTSLWRSFLPFCLRPSVCNCNRFWLKA